MANDALDPGPNGDFPWWPRNPDGSSRMPFGLRRHRAPDGSEHLIDITVRDPVTGAPLGPADYVAAALAAEGTP